MELKLEERGRKRSNGSFRHLLLVLLVATLGSTLGTELDCTDFNRPGVTYPKGDINIEVGSILEVACILDLTHQETEGLDSANIEFAVHVKKPIGMPDVSMDEVRRSTRVVNKTTAVLKMAGLQASQQSVSCLIPDGSSDHHMSNLVCHNDVNIGYTPQNVTKFECLVRDWSELRCDWTLSDNQINTSYSLSLVQSRLTWSCPKNTTTSSSCVWGERTEPHYQPNIHTLDFRLRGSNVLRPDGVEFRFRIDHFSIVVPQPPDIIETRAHPGPRGGVIYVKWTFLKMKLFRPGLQHRITVCLKQNSSICEPPTELASNQTDILDHNFSVNYANQDYTVTIQMRSYTAKDEDKFWSTPKSTTIKSLPIEPELPPAGLFDMGGFEFHGQTTLEIYWREIPPLLRNGPDFGYDITVTGDGSTLEVNPSEGKNFSAEIHAGKRNRFRIEAFARNSVGRSSTSSTLRVLRDGVPPPQKVSKYDYSNGTFEISWSPPSNPPRDLSSYTVFKCTGPRRCSKDFDWVSVPGARSSRFVFHDLPSEPTIYHFAVSANSREASSGMVWAMCNLDEKVPEKLKGLSKTFADQNTIGISWSSGCSYRPGSIKGFNVYYCPIQSASSPKCIDDKEQIILLEDLEEQSFALTNLDPYTLYRIQVSVLSHSGFESRSEPLTVQTAEAAPNGPPQIALSDTSDSSIFLEISPPKELNGQLRYFRVQIIGSNSTNPTFVNQVKELPYTQKEEIYEFGGLTSYSYFVMMVAACTVECSNYSEPLNATTRIGKSSVYGKPHIESKDGILRVSWNRTQIVQGGPLVRLEVLITKNGAELTPGRYPGVDPTASFYEDDLSCDSSANFSARVRAITYNGSLPILGNWSSPETFICGEGGHWVLGLIAIIVSILILIFLAITGLKCWNKLMKMKAIHVEIPEGLSYSTAEPKRSRKNSGGDTGIFGSEMNVLGEGSNFLHSETVDTEQGNIKEEVKESGPPPNDSLPNEVITEDSLSPSMAASDLWFWNNPTAAIPSSIPQPKSNDEESKFTQEEPLMSNGRIPTSRSEGDSEPLVANSVKVSFSSAKMSPKTPNEVASTSTSAKTGNGASPSYVTLSQLPSCAPKQPYRDFSALQPTSTLT